MANDNTPGSGAYPLTIVGFDAAGNECYRTQLDWSGQERNLDDVPSADLDARVPTWKTVKIYDQAGKVVVERTNENNEESADDAIEARGPKYANDKRPIVETDVPNNKDGEQGDPESDAQASNSSKAKPSSAKADEGKDVKDDKVASAKK
jgi:hypothetical protein